MEEKTPKKNAEKSSAEMKSNKSDMPAKSSKMMLLLAVFTIMAFFFGGAAGALIGYAFGSKDTTEGKVEDKKVEATVKPTKEDDEDMPPVPKPEDKPAKEDVCADRDYVKSFGGFYEMSFSVLCDQNTYISSNFETGLTVYVNDSYVDFIYATDAPPGYVVVTVGEPGTDTADYLKSSYDSSTGVAYTNSEGLNMLKETSSGPLGDYTSFFGKVNLGGTDYYYSVSYDGHVSTAGIDKVLDTLDFN